MIVITLENPELDPVIYGLSGTLKTVTAFLPSFNDAFACVNLAKDGSVSRNSELIIYEQVLMIPLHVTI